MKDLIYCQRSIPADELRYGFRTSAATGCGWIATYNALRILGKKAEPEALIRYYERQLPLLHGNTGTSFWGPAVFSGSTASTPGWRSAGTGSMRWWRDPGSACCFTTGERASGSGPTSSPCTKRTGASLAIIPTKIPPGRTCMGRVWTGSWTGGAISAACWWV